MKIPIQVQGERLDKFTRVFFGYLERDDGFERLVRDARKKLSLKIKTPNKSKELDVVYKPQRVLLSEIKNIKSFNSSVIYLGNPELEKQLDLIIKQYPFMRDWKDGLSHFICGDRFFIDNDTYPIKIRVRNKKYPYKGRFTDRPSDEGVKIVLTGEVSKNELKKWINDNYEAINTLLKELTSLSRNSPRKTNFDRDRLIVYLRDKWKLTWGKISKVLIEGGEPTETYKTLQSRIMKAYNQFPSKI